MQYIHKVKKNENLRSICQKYCVAKVDLLTSNNVTEKDIHEGLLLYIEVPDGMRYVVKPFDTVQKIAQKFGVSREELLAFNHIKEVFLGQIIYIPSK